MAGRYLAYKLQDFVDGTNSSLASWGETMVSVRLVEFVWRGRIAAGDCAVCGCPETMLRTPDCKEQANYSGSRNFMLPL